SPIAPTQTRTARERTGPSPTEREPTTVNERSLAPRRAGAFPKGGLIHKREEIVFLDPREFIECAHCHAEHDRLSSGDLPEKDNGDVICDDCGRCGWIARGSVRETVRQRRPMLSGGFWPMPSELLDHGRTLGLD